jgi:hypothetical protein
MLLLAALVLQPSSTQPQVRVQSLASVRIERPTTARAADWERSPSQMRKETLLIDERGQPILLRLIENP